MNGTQPAAPLVVAMLKAPRAGLVKTRLAQEIGTHAATAIYRRLVAHQLASIPPRWEAEIHFAPADAGAEMQHWLGARWSYHAQDGGDLGERLTHAIAGAFTRGAPAVVVIGGDCPGLDEATLNETVEALRACDVVLGPALDGGYYLIGLRCPAPRLFTGIPWSSPGVLAATLARIRETGLSHTLLTVKEDVDDLASWRRLKGMLPDGAFEAESRAGAIAP